MSDPHISHDWKREIIEELVGEADLSDEDIDEILNGHADLVDRHEVSVENMDPYSLLVERYGLSQQEAYNKMMNVLHEDLEYWTPDEQELLAEVIDFSHEVPTNYSRAEDGLDKQRSHYGAKHPDTGEVIIHSFHDEYVKQRQLEDE